MNGEHRAGYGRPTPAPGERGARRDRTASWGLVVLAAVVALTACARVPSPPPSEVRDGYPERGARLIQQYGCGGCHTVPGVDRADGLVGPPLTRFGARSYIAGELPNNADNLRRWIQDPRSVEPGTAMPDLGVSELDARDISAYLFTLK